MKSRLAAIAILVTALCTALPAYAQMNEGSGSSDGSRRFGLGVSDGGSNIFLPIDVGGRFRFEPSLRFQRSAQEDGNSELSSTYLRAGVGVFKLSQIRESTRSYIGLRVAVGRSTRHDFYIGPSIGGECLFTDHFTVGIEAGCDYVKYGNYDENSDRKYSMIDTYTKIILRLFL
jgi:hypothetical protein